MKFSAVLFVVSLASVDAVASGRSKLGTLAKDDAAASPWLSLLTKSWALPGEPQEEQSKGLDSLASSIVQLAKSRKAGQPADASMEAAIESIKAILKDMQDAVLTGNAAAQKEIFRKQNAVITCAEPNVTNKVTWEASLNVTIKDVIECREHEKVYYDDYESCKGEEARCSNTTACCAQIIQPNPYCLNPPVGPSPLSLQTTCAGASKCRENDLHNKLGFFEAKLKEYNDAELLCEASRTGCNDTYTCPDKRVKWQEKHAICNMNQTVFEQAYCNLATDVESSWESYSLCYMHNKQALVAEEEKQDTLLVNRRQEWRGLARIECLLSALKASEKEDALQACLKADQTEKANSTLKLSFPSREGNITAMDTCGEKLESPGTEFFIKTYYHLIPPVLLPASLTTYHCVSGVASSHCPLASSPVSLFAKAHYVPRARWGPIAHA